MVLWVLIDALLGMALVVLYLFLSRLRQVAQFAPVLARSPQDSPAQALESQLRSRPRLSVIIPAYDEAVNIRDCLQSVRAGLSDVPAIEVIVVDDQSTDETLAIAQAWAAEQDPITAPQVQVLAGRARPTDITWAGKNWACVQGAEQAQGDLLLFLDADVRLKPGVAAALQTLEREQLDLLTLIPEIECGCLAEWLVQPLIASLLIGGFDFAEVNDPQHAAAFAAGHFMLFRRKSYDQIGGHRAVANQPVEDVELARRMKPAGLRLKYMAGRQVASVRMYRSWGALWEGWTKNWHLGSRRDFAVARLSGLIMLWGCAIPWFGGLGLLGNVILTQSVGVWDGGGLAIALVAIGLHYRLRQTIQVVVGIPPRYWWLTGVGGMVVTAIVLVSVIKTETGWGWTWRGRSLTLPEPL